MTKATKDKRLVELHKLLGPTAGYQENKKAPDGDGRAEAREKGIALKSSLDALNERIKVRRAELLNVPDYKEMIEESRRLDIQRQEAFSRAMSKRFTVGTIGPLFFSVVTDGDTWEEVMKTLREKKAR